MAADLVELTPRPQALPALPASPALAVPALVADLGSSAAWRYVEFFTANVRNPWSLDRQPGCLHLSVVVWVKQLRRDRQRRYA